MPLDKLPRAIQLAAQELLKRHRLPIPVHVKMGVTATYFVRRGTPGDDPRAHIQFGGRMIIHHLEPAFWGRSLSELAGFGMLSERRSAPAFTLAAMVIHEVAHALDARNRPKGKLGHGKPYLRVYREELEARLEGVAARLCELVDDERLLEPRSAILALAKEKRGSLSSGRKQELRGGFRAGQWVSFEDKEGERVVGKLGPFRRKRWSFIERVAASGKRTARRYLVPSRMLSAHPPRDGSPKS
jgi:hypothetical protein